MLLLANRLVSGIVKAAYIAKKDAKLYYFKWPNITFGLFLPAIIYIAFSLGRSPEIASTLPGLVAMAGLFGAGAILSVALPLERAKGTFDRLRAAPVSLTTIVVGKTLGGFFFGTVLSTVYSLIVIPFSGVVLVNPVVFAFGIVLSSFTFSALGACMSAPFGDVPEAMPPATLIRVLMVFLGGVLLPVTAMPGFLQFIAFLLPITYAVDLIRQGLAMQIAAQMLLLDIAILIAFAVSFLGLAVLILKRTLH